MHSDAVPSISLSSAVFAYVQANWQMKWWLKSVQDAESVLCLQLMHSEVQSQCKEHKERLQKLQNTYHMLRTACDKRMSDLSRIDRALEQSVNTRCTACFAQCFQLVAALHPSDAKHIYHSVLLHKRSIAMALLHYA